MASSRASMTSASSSSSGPKPEVQHFRVRASDSTHQRDYCQNRGLTGNNLRGQDNIAELERLIGGNVIVKGRIALKREHIGGAVDTATRG